MLFEILNHLHIFNYGADDKLVYAVHSGEFAIESGTLFVDFLQPGQRFAIIGSAMNDGVHEYGYGEELNDEYFDGKIFVLRKIPAFDKLVFDIAEYCRKNGTETPYASESFGGYSYTKSADAVDGWAGVFKKRLAPWRKL